MIGIMSDSHDNLHNVNRAVDIFVERSCRMVIHAGDFVAPFSAHALGRLDCPVRSVFGNCDGERAGLVRVLGGFGEIQDEPYSFVWEGIRFIIKHLDRGVSELCQREEPDVLVYGHTHKPEIDQRGSTLIINPGETGGWVNGRPSVALLDTETLEAEILSL